MSGLLEKLLKKNKSSQQKYKTENESGNQNKIREKNKEVDRNSSNVSLSSHISGVTLSEPMVINWQNKEAFVYAVESKYNRDDGSDLEFVIYLPIDSAVQWLNTNQSNKGIGGSKGKGPSKGGSTGRPEKRSQDKQDKEKDNPYYGQDDDNVVKETMRKRPETVITEGDATTLRNEFIEDPETHRGRKTEEKEDDFDWETGKSLHKLLYDDSPKSKNKTDTLLTFDDYSEFSSDETPPSPPPPRKSEKIEKKTPPEKISSINKKARVKSQEPESETSDDTYESQKPLPPPPRKSEKIEKKTTPEKISSINKKARVKSQEPESETSDDTYESQKPLPPPPPRQSEKIEKKTPSERTSKKNEKARGKSKDPGSETSDDTSKSQKSKSKKLKAKPKKLKSWDDSEDERNFKDKMILKPPSTPPSSADFGPLKLFLDPGNIKRSHSRRRT